MKTAKEIFIEVWKEHFGDEINNRLNIVLEHDYIFEAMERYTGQVEPEVKPEIADDVEKLKELWYARNPAHEVETGTGEDMFWKTVLMIIKEYNNR